MHGVNGHPSKLRYGYDIPVALLIICALFVSNSAGQVAATNIAQAGSGGPTAQRLAPGQTVERELNGGEAHTYLVSLRRGEFLRALVEQRGVDVGVTLYDRADAKLVEVNLLDAAGAEPVSYEATHDGDYLLEVWTYTDEPRTGRYSIVISVKPRATADDRMRASAERLLVEGGDPYVSGPAINLRKALANVDQSLPLWRALDDKYWLAYALNSVGVIHNGLGDRQKAVNFLQQALGLRRSISDQPGEAVTLENLGYLHKATGRKQDAVDFFKQAAAAYHAFGGRLREAYVLNQIGLLYDELGENQKALDLYTEALAILKDENARLTEGDVLNNIGVSYWKLKDREKALDYYKRALVIYENNDGRANSANTLTSVGLLYWEAGDRQKALEYYEQALTQSRAAGDRNLEAAALAKLGDVNYQLGERKKALEYYGRALKLPQVARGRLNRPQLFYNIASLYRDLGEWQRAFDNYQQVLRLCRADGQKKCEADIVKAIAELFYRQDKKKAIGYYLELARLQRAAKNYKAEAETFRTVGFLYDDLRQWPSALEYLSRTLAIYRANGDRSGEADTLVNLGNIYYHQGKMAVALSHYEQGLRLYDSEKPGWAQGNALNSIGLVYHNLGDKSKALEYYARALPLFLKSGDKKGEAAVLLDIGLIYADRGEQQKALEYYKQSLSLRIELGDGRGTANTLVNIGVSYQAIGDNEKAIVSFADALKIRQASGDKYGEAVALAKLGKTYLALGELSKGSEHYQQALLLFRDAGDRDSATDALFNLIFIKLGLGEPQSALTYIKQAEAIARADRDEALEALIRILSGGVNLQLKKAQTASAQFRQSFHVFKAEGGTMGQAAWFVLVGLMYAASGDHVNALEHLNQGLVYLKDSDSPKLRADAQKLVGIAYAEMGRSAEALDAYAQALNFYRAAHDTSGEASVLVLTGSVYEGQGEKEKAALYYARAYSLRLGGGGDAGTSAPLESKAGTYDSLGERKGPQGSLGGEQQRLLTHYFGNYQSAKAGGLVGPEAEALSRMMGTIREQTPELAIILGKQAVEKYQEVRSNPGQYNMRAAEDTYLQSFPSTCRDLADLLIAKGRLYEAEQVITILKEEEYTQYVRRDGSEAAEFSRRPDLRPEERRLFAEYARIFDNTTAIGSRLATLRTKEANGERLSAEEETERARLTKELNTATEGFNAFLDQIKTELNYSGRNVVREIKDDSGLQTDLEKLGRGTVALYTFVGQRRYRVILTTPEARVDGKTEISAAELNKKIMAFRRTLMNPAADPRPQGRELYDILIKPVEKQLEEANAKTLIWELDGALRYLPLPALYDGRQYMVEKYSQVMITLASRTRLLEQTMGEWRGLGVGVSAQWGTFPALPAVVGELESIIRNDDSPSAVRPAKEAVVGVLPGLRLLDKDFTAQSFADALGRNFTIVHIASHFNFSPGGADKSFLLLGDGNRLTLKTIESAAEYKLKGVELLTLSACNTGIEGGDEGAAPNGSEVENFGVIAQRRGAKAVIATLWSVADDSTGALMREFYRIYATIPGITKAEALRLAQVALLRGNMTVNSAVGRHPRADVVGVSSLKPDAVPYPFDPAKPYAHPYYWAPFMLIGNWR